MTAAVPLVRSIVGRFLEHTRIVYFHNDGDHEIFCGSADWMERNLFSRVEVVFPILDPLLRDKVYKEGLAPYLTDNTQSWQLQSDGNYKRNKPGNARPRNTQRLLLEKLSKPCQ